MSSCFSDELTVWRNGLEQLPDNSFLLLNNEDDGSLNLRCLGTQGNYDLIWKTVGISELPQVISSTTPDVTISYVTNDANITLHDFRRFEGTLRCESQQSGLTISIHLTRGELVLCLVLSIQTFWTSSFRSQRRILGYVGLILIKSGTLPGLAQSLGSLMPNPVLKWGALPLQVRIL